MNINIFVVLYLLTTHYVADFLFQSNEMALNKSKSIKWLTIHVATYTGIWFISMILYQYFNQVYNNIPIDLNSIFKFSTVTFITHWLTDYFTSRWASKERLKAIPTNNYKSFFSVVGLDQLIHYTTIILSFKYFIL